MRLFLPVRRATLTIPSGPANDPSQEHLHILLTDPYGAERQVLVVSISTFRPGLPHDSTCFLYPGDHEFVRVQSYVYYALAHIVTEQQLLDRVRSGECRGRDSLDVGIMARVCQGLNDSPHTKPAIKSFYLAATAPAA